MASALDRTNVSDRKAAFVVSATIRAMGAEPSDYCLNKESIRQARRKNRTDVAASIKEACDPQNPLTVHWDGKLLPTLTSKEKVDRLAILVSAPGFVKLIGVPILERGTGSAEANAVYTTLDDWNIIDKVQAMLLILLVVIQTKPMVHVCYSKASLAEISFTWPVDTTSLSL